MIVKMSGSDKRWATWLKILCDIFSTIKTLSQAVPPYFRWKRNPRKVLGTFGSDGTKTLLRILLSLKKKISLSHADNRAQWSFLPSVFSLNSNPKPVPQPHIINLSIILRTITRHMSNHQVIPSTGIMVQWPFLINPLNLDVSPMDIHVHHMFHIHKAHNGPQIPHLPSRVCQKPPGSGFQPNRSFRNERLLKKGKVFTLFGGSYASLFQNLKQLDMLNSIQIKIPNLLLKMWDSLQRCSYCLDASGHDIEKCSKLKKAIQELIDVGGIVMPNQDAADTSKSPSPVQNE